MNTERMFRTSTFQFAKKEHLAIVFTHTDVIVGNAREGLLHLVELMIVSGKQHLGMTGRDILVDVFDNSPGNGNAIVGRSASTQLVEEDKTARREIVENVGSFGHLYHESRFAQRDIIGSTNTGEDLIDNADMSRIGRHEAAHMSHKHNKCRLTKQSRLTCHVRTSDHHDLLLLVVKQDIVGNI